MDLNAECLYGKDFYAWAMTNAELLRKGSLTEIDAENIAEEIESLGRSERRELTNRIAVLIAHLLKWEFQPSKRSSGWKGTIKEQRRQISKLLRDNPSLKNAVPDMLADAYESSIIIASVDTGIPEFDFPKSCHFSVEQVLNEEFLPPDSSSEP